MADLLLPQKRHQSPVRLCDRSNDDASNDDASNDGASARRSRGPDGKGEALIRTLFGGLVLFGTWLACSCLPILAGSAPIEKTQQGSSMRFEWRGERLAELCGKTCRRWISAVGPITDRTPHDFEAFGAQEGLRGATLVLDSEGGSVVNTIQLGRTPRRLDIT